jgi:hypothetical protein
MDTPSREPTSSTDATTADLLVQAESSIRELLAFDEIITEISAQKDAHSEEWMRSNLPLMNEKTRKGFGDSLTKFAEMMVEVRDYLHERGTSEEPEPWEGVGMSIPDNEAAIAFTNFLLDTVYRLGNRSEMVGRAFLIAAESSFEVFLAS